MHVAMHDLDLTFIPFLDLGILGACVWLVCVILRFGGSDDIQRTVYRVQRVAFALALVGWLGFKVCEWRYEARMAEHQGSLP
jgi:hypothetical protein